MPDILEALRRAADTASDDPDVWTLRITLPDGTVVTHTYRPTPQQRQFHEARARYVLFGGAVGPGKTRALCEHILMRMVQWPGLPVLLLRRDLKDLRQTTEVEWRRVCPPALYSPQYGGQHNKADHFYRLWNGSTLYLGPAKDWESYKSGEYGLIAIDELNEISEEFYQNIETRLRWTTGSGRCRLSACAGTPPHPTHPLHQIVAATNPTAGWVKRRWYDPYQQGKELPNHRFIPARTLDNPYLPPTYVESLLSTHSQEWVRNYVYGEWSAFEHAVFSISRTRHAWHAALPKFDVVEGGIDWGSPTATQAHRTTAVIAGRTPDGLVIAFDLYSTRGTAIEDLIDWLSKRTTAYEVRRWWADSSQARANELLRSQGLPVYDADRRPKTVAQDIQTIKQLLEAEPPRLYLTTSPAMERLWAGLESYQYDPDTERPLKHQEDDEVDALRYALRSITKRPAYNADTPTPYVPKTNPSRNSAYDAILAHRRAILRRLLDDQ